MQTPPGDKNRPQAVPQPQLTRRRRLLRVLRENRHHLAWSGITILVTLLSLIAYNALRPAAPPIGEREIKQVVAKAMASATPPPATAARIFDAVWPSVVFIATETQGAEGSGEPERASGSGVVLDTFATILTSLHVVAEADTIEVIFADGTRTPATIIARDPTKDIAVLRPLQPPAVVLPAVLGSPATLNVGDEAIVIGNPFGLRHSVTAGVISGLKRSFKPPNSAEPLTDLIQFDAAVNPGNSGGPLFNRNGEVVGIVTALANPTDQSVFIGIGFAVPIDTAAGVAGPPDY